MTNTLAYNTSVITTTEKSFIARFQESNVAWQYFSLKKPEHIKVSLGYLLMVFKVLWYLWYYGIMVFMVFQGMTSTLVLIMTINSF